MEKPSDSIHFRWLIWTAVLLLLFSVLSIGLIDSGIFNPSPDGTLSWLLEDQQMVLSPQSRDIIWLDEKVLDSAKTIRLNAAHISGEEDIGYGLVLGDETNYLAVAVSPLGYLAIWESETQSTGSPDSYLLEWQTWPHVQRDNSPNEIWVDIVGNRAAVRINREWLWEGEISNGSGTIGLIGESFADWAVIDFASVELFTAKDG